MSNKDGQEQQTVTVADTSGGFSLKNTNENNQEGSITLPSNNDLIMSYNHDFNGSSQLQDYQNSDMYQLQNVLNKQ